MTASGDEAPVMSKAIFDCLARVRGSAPTDLDQARRLAHEELAARGMDTSNDYRIYVESIAKEGLRRPVLSYQLPRIKRRVRARLERAGVLRERMWWEPPRFAKRRNVGGREEVVYPRTQIGLARYPFSRLIAELASHPERPLASVAHPAQRTCPVWLAIDPLADGAMRVSVNIGDFVVGDVLASDVDRLQAHQAAHLPEFGTSIVVDGVLIGSDAESARLALRFQLPSASA